MSVGVTVATQNVSSLTRNSVEKTACLDVSVSRGILGTQQATVSKREHARLQKVIFPKFQKMNIRMSAKHEIERLRQRL